LAAIRCKSNINFEYLYSYLNLIKGNIEKQGAGSTFKAITGNQLKKLKIKVPPLNKQEKFNENAKINLSIKKRQKESTKEVDTLFNALIQKAFKGELVTS
jgi:type I restriction enzyme, S subunit